MDKPGGLFLFRHGLMVAATNACCRMRSPSVARSLHCQDFQVLHFWPVGLNCDGALLPSIIGLISPTNLSMFTMLLRTILIASSGNPDSSVKVYPVKTSPDSSAPQKRNTRSLNLSNSRMSPTPFFALSIFT